MKPFDSFVVLAEMRTGSNLLETTLNLFEGVTCHGELFNPAFINKPGTDEYLGVSFAQRNDEPERLLHAVRAQGGLTGFRLFHDHDPRIRAHVLDDPRCAKIVLTRNPLESYVSRKIAAATDQWKLHNVARLRSAQVAFEADEFEAHVQRHQDVQLAIQHDLQTSGQSAFYIGYDDLNDVAVLNGLAQWLGIAARIEAPSRTLKKQNPEPIEQKLTNPEVLAPALARIDWTGLGRTPNFEPRRPPMLGPCHAGTQTPLMFMPLRSAPEDGPIRWLAALDGVAPSDLHSGFDLARLREWRRANPGHRSFTVLRHPLLRAHAAFCRRVLSGETKPVREHLDRLYGIALPDAPVQLEPDAHRTAFLAFLRFVRASLSGQTALQPWPFWASQSALLEGLAQVGPPDHLLREDDLARDLPWLAGMVGHGSAPAWQPEPGPGPLLPTDVEVIEAAREAYHRDYEQFGFGDLPMPPAAT